MTDSLTEKFELKKEELQGLVQQQEWHAQQLRDVSDEARRVEGEMRMLSALFQEQQEAGKSGKGKEKKTVKDVTGRLAPKSGGSAA